MFTKIAHYLVAKPWVYDTVQFLAGANEIRLRLASQITTLNNTTFVLDIGGGTGLYRQQLPESSNYVCLDIDYRKLQGFLSKHPGEIALCANAAQIPIKSNSVDVVMCTLVSHHLTDTILNLLLQESTRVLKPEGVFIFLDPVWQPTKWVGRLMWKYDRGSYPRTSEELHSMIGGYYRIIYDDLFSIYHEYFICVGVKK